MKTTIIIAIATFISATAFGQTNPEDFIKKFFEEYPKNSNKAIDDAFVSNPWISRSVDAIQQTKDEASKLTIDYVGKYYGYELITRKVLGESFILYSYMVKYDRQPVRFIFKFYKANDKWALYAFKFDTELSSELETASKLYYLNLDK